MTTQPHTAAGRSVLDAWVSALYRRGRTPDVDYWRKRILAIEAEAAALDVHPRTYSLTASGPNGELFLVTDDESGITIGHARKIGGPLTAPARPCNEERLAAAIINEADREGGRTFDVSDALERAERLVAEYARLSADEEGQTLPAPGDGRSKEIERRIHENFKRLASADEEGGTGKRRHDPTDHDCRGGVSGDRFPL